MALEKSHLEAMKRSPKLELPPIVLQRKRGIPLPDQIHAALCRAIAAGDLRPGSRLPASRVLAGSLNVSRNSVLAAFDKLSAEGLISGRTGSGTCVSMNPAVALEVLANRPDDLLRLHESGYPRNPSSLRDPDGNRLYLHG